MHVGSVTNKGTLALVKAQVSELRRIYKNIEISVSTCDVEKLTLSMPEVNSLPLLVDIPFEKADIYARHKEIDRGSFKYNLQVVANSIRMFPEIVLCLISGFCYSVGNRRLYKSSVLSSIVDADFVISTADENFKEGASALSFNVYWRLISWTILLSRAFEILIARHVLKKKIVVFPNSIGPFRTFVGRFLARLIISNVDLILVRETFSLDWIESLGVSTPVVITSDIALLSEFDRLSRGSANNEKPRVVVCPGIYASTLSQRKQRDYVEAHARALDGLVSQHGAEIVFLPFEVTGKKNDDRMFCELVLKKMENGQSSKIVETATLEDFAFQVSRASLMLSSRMHSSVISCLLKIPTVVISYDFKQLGLLEQLDLSRYAVNINQISYESLMPIIEDVWKNLSAIREHLEMYVPILQRNTRDKIEASCRRFLPT